MSYKAGIIEAITELKDRTGSSSIAIKKHMQAEMGDKKWLNGIFLKALKDGVASGDFVKVKASYKLSAAAKTAAKKKAAPKKPKAAPEKPKTAPKKKAAPKKKTAPKKKAAAKKKPATKKKAAPKKKTTSKKKPATKGVAETTVPPAADSTEPVRVRRLGDPRKVTDTHLLSLPFEQMPPVPMPMLRGAGRMIEAIEHPGTDYISNLAPGALGLATTAAVGLYLYKKKRTNN